MVKSQTGRFVGRKTYLKEFNKTLVNPKGKKHVYLICGPGGIGKTWLVNQLLDEARKLESCTTLSLIDMYSTTHQSIEGVMDAVVERLRSEAKIDLVEYEGRREELRRARSRRDYPQGGIQKRLDDVIRAFRSCLAIVADQKTVVLAFDTFEHVQDGTVGQWILNEDGLQMPGVVCIVASRKAFADDAPLLEGFTFQEALDFYDRYTQSPAPLQPESGRQYRRELRILNSLVGGNPLLLGLAIFWWELQRPTWEELNAYSDAHDNFKEQIVRSLHPIGPTGSHRIGGIHLDEGMYQTLVLMACLNRRFNRFLLRHLATGRYLRLDGVSEGQVWSQLQGPHFFFVKERPHDEVQLHDVLAEMLREHFISDVFGEFEGIPGERWSEFIRDIGKLV